MCVSYVCGPILYSPNEYEACPATATVILLVTDVP